AAHRRNRARRLGAKRRMDLGEVMDAEIGQLPTRIVVEPAKAVEGPVLVVAHLRRRAEPGVPVDARRRLAVGRVADALGPLVLDVEAARHGDLADAAAANEFGRLLAPGGRAALD